MERLAYAITDHLLRRDVIQKEDYDIYVYGYAVFLEQMCQVIGFILIGIVTNTILQYAIYFLTLKINYYSILNIKFYSNNIKTFFN